MKTLLFFVIILLFFFVSGCSDSGNPASSPSEKEGVWVQTAGPEDGNIQSLNAQLTNQLYAGTSGGGLFRSTDLGNSWQHTNTPYMQNITAMAFNKSGAFFIGTQISTYQSVIFQSLDTGKNWQESSTRLRGNRVFSIVFNFQEDIFVGTNLALYRSTDNGENWERLSEEIFNEEVNDIIINVTGDILVGTGFWDRSGGLYRSVDNGNSWAQIQSNLPAGIAVNALKIHPNGNMFAAVGGSVYTSFNQGYDWFRVNGDVFLSPVTHLEINRNGEVFARCGQGIFRSKDLGNTWTNVSHENFEDLIDLKLDEQGRLYSATRGHGLFTTANNGNTWENRPYRMINSRVYNAAVNKQGDIFANCRNGLFFSGDNGNSWERIGGAFTSNIVFGNGSDVFINRSGLSRSRDNGATWTELLDPFSDGIYSLIRDPEGSIYAGSVGKIARSTNDGDSWEDVSNGLPDIAVLDMVVDDANRVFAGTNSLGIFQLNKTLNIWMQINPDIRIYGVRNLTVNNSGELFIGSQGAGVYRYRINNRNLQEVNDGLGIVWVTDLAVDAKGNLYVAGPEGVYVSDNSGDSWTEINDGLEFTRNVNTVAFDPGGWLYAGTNGAGVFKLKLSDF